METSCGSEQPQVRSLEKSRESTIFPVETQRRQQLQGTTSARARKMSGEERQMILLRRKLRNRASAVRSRKRRLDIVESLYKELVQLSTVVSKMEERLGQLEQDTKPFGLDGSVDCLPRLVQPQTQQLPQTQEESLLRTPEWSNFSCSLSPVIVDSVDISDWIFTAEEQLYE